MIQNESMSEQEGSSVDRMIESMIARYIQVWVSLSLSLIILAFVGVEVESRLTSRLLFIVFKFSSTVTNL